MVQRPGAVRSKPQCTLEKLMLQISLHEQQKSMIMWNTFTASGHNRNFMAVLLKLFAMLFFVFYDNHRDTEQLMLRRNMTYF